jgi:glutamate--cysteine ligase
MAVINAFTQDALDQAEPLTVAAAYVQCRDAALAESAIGAIGLEIESHLVDLDHVADPIPWERVEAIAAAVGRVAPSTAVTVEPAGRSSHPGRRTPESARRSPGSGTRAPAPGWPWPSAVSGWLTPGLIRRARPCGSTRGRVIAPKKQHFAATGRAPAGRGMMNSTAALQVNLQAGPMGETSGLRTL